MLMSSTRCCGIQFSFALPTHPFFLLSFPSQMSNQVDSSSNLEAQTVSLAYNRVSSNPCNQSSNHIHTHTHTHTHPLKYLYLWFCFSLWTLPDRYERVECLNPMKTLPLNGKISLWWFIHTQKPGSRKGRKRTGKNGVTRGHGSRKNKSNLW